MIEVNESVEVLSPPQTVWDLLSDPHAVVNCVPGATLGDQHEDGSFDGSLMVKFGPAKVTFHTRVSLALDVAAKVGHVTARGKDNQGGTRVRATMTFKVVEQTDPPGSSIPIEALGAEYYKLDAHKMDFTTSMIKTPDLGKVAVAMGGRGSFATTVGQLCAATAEWVKKPGPMMIDLRISRTVPSVPYRRIHYGLDE